MADFHDITDSTDWISTAIPAMGPVEASLRCEVCKDFYQTPMVTTCDHTFCSLCIRRILSQTSKCPLCLSATQESKLRKCSALEGVIEAFSTARPALIGYCRGRELREQEDETQDPAPSSPAPKRPHEQTSAASPSESRRSKRLRSSAKQNVSYKDAELELQEQEPTSKPVAEPDTDYQEIPNDNLFPCPICNKRMKEELVYPHLDTCGSQPPTPAPAASKTASSSTLKANPFQRLQPAARAAPERLPALNYSLIKDTALRKKLTELGLSSQGSRSLLERRHREWTTLWNANCDSAKPKRKVELVRELEQWERVIANPRPAVVLRASNNTAAAALNIKEKDFDGSAWAVKHESSFKDLIASARRSRQQATEPAAGEDSQEKSAVDESSQENSTVDETPQAKSTVIEDHKQQHNQSTLPERDCDMVILDERPDVFGSTSLSVTQQTETLKLVDPQSDAAASTYPDEIPSSSQMSNV